MRLLTLSGTRQSMAPQLGHPPQAWDLARAAYVARTSFGARLISEDEAWTVLTALTIPTRAAYQSWAEYSKDYVDARRIWAKSFKMPTFLRNTFTKRARRKMLDPANTASPWTQAPWNPGPSLPVSLTPQSANLDPTSQITPGWRFVGLVFAGNPLDLAGVNPWREEWIPTYAAPITVAHSLLLDRHQQAESYRIATPTSTISFATTEFVIGIWGFFRPLASDLSS